MERRRAVAIAAATVATTLGAMAAVTANFGLLGFGAVESKPVGRLDAGRAAEVLTPPAPITAPAAPAPNVTVRYEDIYRPAPATPPAAAPPAASSPQVSGPTTTVVTDNGARTVGYETGEGHEDDHERDDADHEDHEQEDD